MKNDEYFIDFSKEKDLEVILSAMYGLYIQYPDYFISLESKNKKGVK
jgi:hypothetical protein